MGRLRPKGALLKILLHLCCAPCTIYPLRILRGEGIGVCGLFYNPNIHPYLEYRRRLDTVTSYAASEGLAVIREEAYPIEVFLRQIAFREEERCRYCYQIRLSHAARVAREGLFDAFTTTLLYSRHQKHDLIREIGRRFPSSTGISAKGGPKGSGFQRKGGCTGSLTAGASLVKKSGTAATSGWKRAAVRPIEHLPDRKIFGREGFGTGCVSSNTVQACKPRYNGGRDETASRE
jgi:predicted adenine nucleotide alpha hydrolase (AANH) superfamily ATPase